ncbi:hypothetical protein B1748_23835 [Paenibacillus sp. MY03]|uniref:S-layer homology domain-containing protein n=1 Tax=Paenibacillus sp. MY03 TaxID=302980 RepID=UPI000B3C93A3|nr:S-layer homology domain-containing protein [Paenibacillus sp. MY03]OUS73040.1 hypothetical protein B1748_23835 [Paenibacillus sp. MY03]
MKRIATIALSALLTMGAFSGLASAATELTAQQKFDALKAKGIFDGMDSTGTSALDQNMTRAQFAKVAALLTGLKVDSNPVTSTFNDVSADNWATGYIEAAKKAGLIEGVGGGNFNPSGNVTQEQLAAVMVRALGIQTDTNAVVGGVSDWAKGYVAAAVNAGLIAGVTDFTAPAKREALVVSSYATDELQTDIKAVENENKPAIGKLLALGTFSANGDQFGPQNSMTKEDVLQALDSMTNGKFDAASLQLNAPPTFAEVLRAYLLALGYPADSLQDADRLIDKAIDSGIVSKDSPLLKIQQLNLPLTRQWGSYLTAGTLFDATTVTVDSNGNVKQNADKHLSETMKLPDAPIQVKLSDVQDVPTYDKLSLIDPSIEERVTTVPTTVPTTPVYTDTTAPTITGATITLSGSPTTSKTVTISGGNSGTIELDVTDKLIGGTISVSEASTLTITKIGDIDLTSLSSLLTQPLSAGSNLLNLITFLDDTIDPQDDGISASFLANQATSNGLVVNGNLRDSAGNVQQIILTFSFPT